MESWKTVPRSGDILGNIALFVPFGLAAYFYSLLPGGRHSKTTFFIMTWLVVAAGSQVVQFFIPSRDPSIFDLYCNAIGAILGWVLGRLVPRETTPGSSTLNVLRQIPLLLPLLWLASLLLPFVPTIDFQAYKSALKPLFLHPQWSWYDGLMQMNCWIVCFYLLHKRAGLSLRPGHLLSAMIGIFLLKIVIVRNSVSLTDVVAVVFALGLWIPMRERNLRSGLLGCSLLVSLAINAVFPFMTREQLAVFSWVPFSGFLQGSMLVNATALCQKLFVFGSVVFLMLQDKSDWKKRALLIASILLVLEIIQVWIASGTPEVTDPLLFLAIAWLYFSIGESYAAPGLRRSHAAGPGDPSIAANSPGSSDLMVPATPLPQQYSQGRDLTTKPPGEKVARKKSNKTWVVIVVAIYCAAASLFLKILLGIPGVPYNVAELFRFGANGIDLLFFSLALLSFGWGSAWLGRVFAAANKPLRDIPLALIKLTFVIYLLLWLSVTRESFMDVAGSSVFVHRVAERGVLGELGVQIIELIGRANVYAVTVIFEPIIRFGALVGPFLIFSGICFFLVQRADYWTLKSKLPARWYAEACICLMLCLYLSKVIAFDWSSTDNLNELVARDGPWGIGGGGYLYLLVLLFCGLSALCTWAHFKDIKAMVISLIIAALSLPISWLLLNNGLEQDIGKYGLRFSGVDFLLGPDRRTRISGQELFFRWSVLHMFIVVGLAFGASLYMYWSVSNKHVRSSRNKAADSFRYKLNQEMINPGRNREASEVTTSSMIDRPDNPKESVKEIPAGRREVLLNLYRSQAKFLSYLAAATGLEPSDICQRLLGFAVEPGSDWQSDLLYSSAIQNELKWFTREPGVGKWVQVPVYLDATHFDHLSSFAAHHSASNSKAMRHLLADYMSRSGIPSRRNRKSRNFYSKLMMFVKSRSYSTGALAGLIAALGLIVIFALQDDRSIKVGPHWAGNDAALIFDPHTHTSYSDGALSPTDLVEMAVENGCDALAISDHSDTKGTVSDQQMLELQDVRARYPDFLLFSGIELNMPSYGGREHATLIADPSVPTETLQQLRDVAESSLKKARKGGGSRAFDMQLLQMIADYQSLKNGLLLFYNHPARKDGDIAENLSDLTQWNARSPVFTAIEGAPGHQNAPVIGSYQEPYLTVDRWDPVVAEVGGIWDQLLSDGHQIWGALASSDYHNERLDQAPCAFSRTHLIVPEQSYRGVLMALNVGTFWADHGRILNQLRFSVDLDGLEQSAFPGYTVDVGDRDSLGVMNLVIERGPGSIGQPLTAEFIGNCSTGKAEILAVEEIPPDDSAASMLIPLAATGPDGESCTLRVRVRLSHGSSTDYLAYTNPVRLILD
jgi:glycopeptide antibiotics resistance protein